MDFDVGQKVRLHGCEVWKVVEVFISLCEAILYYRVKRGCITMVVSGSSLTPYREV